MVNPNLKTFSLLKYCVSDVIAFFFFFGFVLFFLREERLYKKKTPSRSMLHLSPAASAVRTEQLNTTDHPVSPSALSSEP